MSLINDPPREKTRELTGWHVLMCMMVFFGVMFAVNGVFLYFAITTHPGEDVEKSYLQGLHYNDTLAARARQADLGWNAGIGFDDAYKAVIVQVQDASQLDLRGLAITGKLRHLSSENGDQELAFEQQENGLYSAAIIRPKSGIWEVQIQIAQNGAAPIIFEAYKELDVP